MGIRRASAKAPDSKEATDGDQKDAGHSQQGGTNTMEPVVAWHHPSPLHMQQDEASDNCTNYTQDSPSHNLTLRRVAGRHCCLPAPQEPYVNRLLYSS
jgi:hypothetical protein